MKKNVRLIMLYVVILFSLASCKKNKDDVVTPQNSNDNELITTVKLIFIDAANSNNISEAVFRDITGGGSGSNIRLDTIRLEAGKLYNTELLLLDETKNPIDTISNEVKEEGDQHQVFYSFSSGANLSFSYQDQDVNGVPLGLLTSFTTGSATSDKNQTVQVVLKHQGEDKPKTGNGNQSIGSTDVEVNFPLIVK